MGELHVQNTSYVQTQTMIRALEFTLAKDGFGINTQHKDTAKSLLKSMNSKKSVSGRHKQIASLLKKGSSVSQMMKSVGASRRTIFRYLNHIEDAGFNINIDNGKYQIAK